MDSHVVTVDPQLIPEASCVRVLPLSIMLEGREESRLKVIKIEHGSGVDGRRLLMRSWRPGDHTALMGECYSGRKVTVWTPVTQGGRANVWRRRILFAGLVESCQVIRGKTATCLEVIARDSLPSASATWIDSFWVNDNYQPLTIKSGQVVFNPEGLPNRTEGRYKLKGHSVYLFEALAENGRLWTAGDAIEYLLAQVDEAIEVCGLESLRESQYCLNALEVAGLTVMQAIEKIVEGAGRYFVLDRCPVGNCMTAVMRFTENSTGRLVPIAAGSAVRLDRTHFRYPVSNGEARLQVIATGGLKRYESTFELMPGWDRSLESPDYECYSAATSPDFIAVKDVFRKWVLNETGRYSQPPFDSGPRADLSGLFEGDAYTICSRRFLPCISRVENASAGVTLKGGYYVEVSYNGGYRWLPYDGACHILTDECGIYLSHGQFDLTMWIAICKDVLRMRITASVESDTPLREVVTIRPGVGFQKARMATCDAGDRYRYWKVAPGSRFYRGVNSAGQYDDGAALRRYAWQYGKRLFAQVEPARITIPWPRMDIRPGDQIVWHDGERSGQVEKVVLDYSNWQTELWII